MVVVNTWKVVHVALQQRHRILINTRLINVLSTGLSPVNDSSERTSREVAHLLAFDTPTNRCSYHTGDRSHNWKLMQGGNLIIRGRFFDGLR